MYPAAAVNDVFQRVSHVSTPRSGVPQSGLRPSVCGAGRSAQQTVLQHVVHSLSYVLFEVWDKKALKDDLVGSARISTEELNVYADDAGQARASSSPRPAKSVNVKVKHWPFRALLYLLA